MTWNRWLRERLEQRWRSPLSRIVALTGARQVGKTTLVRNAFPALPYVSLDDPVLRPEYAAWSAADWAERLPVAVLDEVQKVPSVIEAVKAAHDAHPETRYLLVGSSQILLLDRVRESLAGRVALEELWPLTLPELDTASWEEPVRPSRWIAWLREGAGDAGVFEGMPAAERSFARHAARFDDYVRFGGMPVVQRSEGEDAERELWLLDYRRTYLERDVADLARLQDLEPFTRAQRAVAARTAGLVNLADLARSAGVSPDTARRFVRYLELSYQVLLLQPWFRNEDKRLAKAPKVHFLDPGVLRAVLDRRGAPTGAEFESAVIAELVKQVRTAGVRARLHHLRTHDGREVDLLVELDEGFVAVEVKQTHRVAPADARGFRGLQDLLDKPLLGALLLSNDRSVRRPLAGVLGVHVAWALGPLG